jgi:hypothetical protein
MTMAFSVNSAGDCVAGTYGWKVVAGAAGRGSGAAVAMTPDISMGVFVTIGRGL